MSGKFETYSVDVQRPDGMTATEMKAYIEEALNTYWGSYEPPNLHSEGDIRWGLKFTRVKRMPKIT